MLCYICKQIPAWFFTKIVDTNADRSMWQTEAENQVLLSPFKAMQYRALEGCDLCKIMVANATTSFLPQEDHFPGMLHLQRGFLNPNNSFALAAGLEDLNIKYFYEAPASWSKTLAMARPDAPDEPIAQMKQWLRICGREHPDCVSGKQLFLPDRLIDLRGNSADSSCLTLRSTIAEQDMGRYCALSHCWGRRESRPWNTIKTNVHSRTRGFKLCELPKTFVDAIGVARSLNIRYIWIDSICILQDDAEDKRCQIRKMGQIFAEAYCTLAAGSATDPLGGCSTSSAKHDTRRYLDLRCGLRRVRIFDGLPTSWMEEYLLSTLRKRAWVLQERELSRRTIQFSRNMLLWECKTARASSQLPWFEMNFSDEAPVPLLNDDRERLGDRETFRDRHEWLLVLESYSCMHLSHESDRLPAITGLVNKTKRARGQYIAGIWEEDMPSALMWNVGDTQEISRYGGGDSFDATSSVNVGDSRRPTTARGPTWSWASVEGPISYASQRQESGYQQPSPSGDYAKLSFQILRLESASAQIESVELQTETRLKIRGRLRAGRVRAPESRDGGGWRQVIEDENGQTVGEVLPDLVAQLQQNQAEYFVPIRNDLYGLHGNNGHAEKLYSVVDGRDLDLVMGLALRALRYETDVFARVGLMRLARRNWFDSIEAREIVLV